MTPNHSPDPRPTQQELQPRLPDKFAIDTDDEFDGGPMVIEYDQEGKMIPLHSSAPEIDPWRVENLIKLTRQARDRDH